MDVDDIPDTDEQNVLDTVEGEIHFFRALMRARPVGMHRFFHVIAMHNAIEKGTKRTVPIDAIWEKLESCYNLEALEALEADYEANGSNSSTPQPASSPSPDQNLAVHHFFRSEFSLPADSYIDSLIASRRMRATVSPPSSPVQSPLAATKPAARTRKRKPSKANLAGLISGDSDSSDLTQESGEEAEDDDAQSPSERRSVATGTDGGTEDMQYEDDETPDADPSSSRQPKKRGRKPGVGGRTRAASNARPSRKRGK